MSPIWCQTIAIATKVNISSIGPLGTNFSEIWIEKFLFKKTELKMSFAKCLPFCLDPDVLSHTKHRKRKIAKMKVHSVINAWKTLQLAIGWQSPYFWVHLSVVYNNQDYHCWQLDSAHTLQLIGVKQHRAHCLVSFVYWAGLNRWVNARKM